MSEQQNTTNSVRTHERVPVRNLVVFTAAVFVGAIAGAPAGVALRSDVAAVLLGVAGAIILASLSLWLVRLVALPPPRYTVCRLAAQNAIVGLLLGFIAGDGVGVMLQMPRGVSGAVGAVVAMVAFGLLTEWYNARRRDGSKAGVADR